MTSNWPKIARPPDENDRWRIGCGSADIRVDDLDVIKDIEGMRNDRAYDKGGWI